MNLIDTPGHVDFNYEVSRSLKACEGALLLIDASQGVEAQTLANAFLAMDQNLTIIPVINKIDLPAADRGALQDANGGIPGLGRLGGHLGLGQGRHRASRKSWRLLSSGFRARRAKREEPLKGLIFDSMFDPYRGVIVFVRMLDGDDQPKALR